ncbi:MAG: SDR family NAD(P)-dependent oxidoreductase [Hyphomicrobiales bacterium]|nr:SDR family NAD(P)-dependent oxidoreductase [Hyphomicrobiales bacterium]
MSSNRILVTGGSGFIGAALVKALLRSGSHVRVLDDNSRGSPRRLADVAADIELVAADIRDADAVERAARGIDKVHHLAFVNGTEFFYKAPDLVLDVGVQGMINVINACRRNDIGTFILASSSEVYQNRRTFRPAKTCRLSYPTRSTRAIHTAPAS